MLLERACELRGAYEGIGSTIAGRMPLAYLHLVQILVDTFLVTVPVALYARAGVWSIFSVGVSSFARSMPAPQDGRKGLPIYRFSDGDAALSNRCHVLHCRAPSEIAGACTHLSNAFPRSRWDQPIPKNGPCRA